MQLNHRQFLNPNGCFLMVQNALIKPLFSGQCSAGSFSSRNASESW